MYEAFRGFGKTLKGLMFCKGFMDLVKSLFKGLCKALERQVLLEAPKGRIDSFMQLILKCNYYLAFIDKKYHFNL